MAFKDRLKEARISNNMTQEQVAEKIGVAKSTFTGYEKGNSEPNMLTISKIMNVLKVDANFLWQDEMNDLGGNPMQLKYDEMKVIEKYQSLDEDGRKFIHTVIDREMKRIKQIEESEERIKVLESRKSNIIPIKDDNISVNAAHERTDIEIKEGERIDDENMLD